MVGFNLNERIIRELKLTTQPVARPIAMRIKEHCPKTGAVFLRRPISSIWA
jgi:hypothetical protein